MVHRNKDPLGGICENSSRYLRSPALALCSFVKVLRRRASKVAGNRVGMLRAARNISQPSFLQETELFSTRWPLPRDQECQDQGPPTVMGGINSTEGRCKQAALAQMGCHCNLAALSNRWIGIRSIFLATFFGVSNSSRFGADTALTGLH